MNTNSLIGPDRLAVIRFLAEMVANVPGNALEVGVYQGGSLSVIAKAMPHKTVYGFDTFSGLPVEKSSKEEIHQPGDFADTSMESVRESLQQWEVYNAKLRKGIFPDCLNGKEIAEEEVVSRICFAHLDVDFEKSMADCLEWVGYRLSPGGMIVVDDYGWERCPGVKIAVTNFLKTRKSYSLYTPVPNQCWLQHNC